MRGERLRIVGVATAELKEKGGTLKRNGISEQMARRGKRMESDIRSDISGEMCALATGCVGGCWRRGEKK